MRAVPAGDKSELVAAYVGEKTGMEFTAGLYTAMAVLNDKNEFVAGVIFSDYRGHDLQISCATETSAAWRDPVMRAVFDYVFNQLGCVRCTSITRKSNKKARGFLEGLGFQLEGSLRLGYDGEKDALIYGFLASECRYLAPLEEADDGQKIPKGTSGSGPVQDGPSPNDDEQGDGGSQRQPEPDQSIHSGRLTRIQPDWY